MRCTAAYKKCIELIFYALLFFYMNNLLYVCKIIKTNIMTSLETRVQKVAKANGLKNFKSEISFAELFRVQNLYMDVYSNEIDRKGIVMKNDMIEKSLLVLLDSDIPFMPYGHAIISEAREDLGNMYFETSNAYSSI